MTGKKGVTNKLLILYCIPDFAKGIFTTMVANYLVYFYQPSVESGIPTIITQGAVFFGILTVIGFIKALGHIIDAFTDPIVASISDKCTNKAGRRIPFMKYSALPYAFCALMIFFAPNDKPTILNNIWIAVFIWGYFIFYTLYMIPHVALLPELITDSNKRVNVYTISSFMFVIGSALGYATPGIVGIFKSFGLEPIVAWRTTFTIFTVIGAVLLLVPPLLIKEKDYVDSVKPTTPIMESLKHTFKNRNFVWVTVGQLLEGTAMAFFQTCIMYYVVSLLGLQESASVLILAVSIAGSLILYPLVNKFVKKIGKKLPIIIGCIVFTIAEFGIFFAADIPVNPMVKAICMAIFVSLPFAVLNIIPAAMMADIIQYDTVKTGINQEGVFSAARSFITKIGQSLAIMIVPSLIIIGANSGENVGSFGIKLTALVGGFLCLLSIVAFCMYDEKEIFSVLKKDN